MHVLEWCELCCRVEQPSLTHTFLVPQHPQPTSFFSWISPAGVVMLVTNQTTAARHLWIKNRQAKMPGYFHPDRIPVLVSCFDLAEGRSEGEDREKGGRRALPSTAWLPEGAHGHGSALNSHSKHRHFEAFKRHLFLPTGEGSPSSVMLLSAGTCMEGPHRCLSLANCFPADSSVHFGRHS